MSDDATDPGPIIRAWWTANLGARDSGAARGLAARLRRGSDIEILTEPAVHDLSRRLALYDAARLLRLVRVLAELRGEDRATLAHRLGGEEPILSNARFQRLMRAEGTELTTALIRAIRMLGPGARSCDIARLGRDLRFWNDRTRTRWSFQYFHAPEPEALQPLFETETDA